MEEARYEEAKAAEEEINKLRALKDKEEQRKLADLKKKDPELKYYFKNPKRLYFEDWEPRSFSLTRKLLIWFSGLVCLVIILITLFLILLSSV